MPPLEIHVYYEGEWRESGEIIPGDRISLYHLKTDGSQEILILECASDNSHSTIHSAKSDIDISFNGSSPTTSEPSQPELVKELKSGESYQTEVLFDINREPRLISFIHREL